MRRYLLDTGIAGDFIHHRGPVRQRALDEARRGNPIGIGVPVLAELYYGVENSATRARNLQLLRGALGTFKIWPFTNAAAARYGRLRAELDRDRAADGTNGHPHRRHRPHNRELHRRLLRLRPRRGPGLSVENWAATP